MAATFVVVVALALSTAQGLSIESLSIEYDGRRGITLTCIGDEYFDTCSWYGPEDQNATTTRWGFDSTEEETIMEPESLRDRAMLEMNGFDIETHDCCKGCYLNLSPTTLDEGDWTCRLASNNGSDDAQPEAEDYISIALNSEVFGVELDEGSFLKVRNMSGLRPTHPNNSSNPSFIYAIGAFVFVVCCCGLAFSR